jgi:hypothetical protein
MYNTLLNNVLNINEILTIPQGNILKYLYITEKRYLEIKLNKK